MFTFSLFASLMKPIHRLVNFVRFAFDGFFEVLFLVDFTSNFSPTAGALFHNCSRAALWFVGVNAFGFGRCFEEEGDLTITFFFCLLGKCGVLGAGGSFPTGEGALEVLNGFL